MKIQISGNFDLTQTLVCNARDSDMHAWLAKGMTMCEPIGLLARPSRSTL
jgi:hypothetical protein